MKAQVQFVDGRPAAECVIVNFSATGARCQLKQADELPTRFKLYIPSRPETKSCILRWRKGAEFGVEYATAASEADSMLQLLLRVEALEGGAPIGRSAESEDFSGRFEAIETRLDDIGQTGERLAAMELHLAALARAVDEGARAPVETRFTEAERKIGALHEAHGEAERRLAILEASALPMTSRADRQAQDARIGALEKSLASMRDEQGVEFSKIYARLRDVSHALEELSFATALPGRLDETEKAIALANSEGDRKVSALRNEMNASLTQMRVAGERRIARIENRAQIGAGSAEDKPQIDPLFERRLGDVERRLDLERVAVAAPAEFGERVTNLEIALMDIKLAQRSAQTEAAMEERMAKAEERSAEIMTLLRNVLAMLTAQHEKRAAG
ncbi:MAG: hypothetical protein KGL46_12540 [Hyphomicrobiales bacterium]|nr:hypothetical protein [Hyphomicrobiales bacterium]